MSRGGLVSHDALALALAFFEAPGRFPDLLHGRAPLPPGMTELLQVAAGDLPEGAAPPLFVSFPELQKAALFFIEQVLLARGADHFRLMGLAPGATAEQIKEHHRLLMRLFHPDRHSVPNEQAAAAAARINRGYSVLRGADTRAAYFVAMQPAAEEAAANTVYPRAVRRSRPPPTNALPPALRRHAPQIVLGAVALVAIGAVAMVYVNRVPEGAIGAGALVGAPRSDSAARGDAVTRFGPSAAVDLLAPAARPANMAPPAQTGGPTGAPRPKPEVPVIATTSPMQSESAGAPTKPAPVQAAAFGPPPASPPVPVQVAASSSPSTPQPSQTTATVVAPAAEPARAEATRAVTQAATVRSEPSREEVSRRADAIGERAAPSTTPAPVAAAAAASAGATTAVGSVEPPTAVLQRFVAAYERGDLEGLMALFDEDARIERGGRARIRRDYEELFRGSEVRSLRLRDLRWSGDGEVVRAEGAFVARVLRRGDEAMRDVGGSVRFELVRRGDRLLIIGLYHSTG